VPTPEPLDTKYMMWTSDNRVKCC